MRFYICDDDEKIRLSYQAKTENITKKNNITAQVSTFESINQIIMEVDDFKASDVLFLDINMPMINGLMGAKKLKQLGFIGEIIFLTNSKTDWPYAFDLEAMNYLIKDECDDRKFEDVIVRAAKKARLKDDEMIWLTSGYEGRHLYISSIYYFEVINRIIVVHYGNNETFKFYSQMNTIENKLLSKGFLRVNRAYLISVQNIETVKANSVRMKNGDEISVGRTYKKEYDKRIRAVSQNDK